MIYQIAKLIWRPSLLKIFRRGADHSLVGNEQSTYMIFGNIIADSYFQIKSFSDDVNNPIKNIKLNLQVRVCTRKFCNCRSYIITTEAEAATDVQ